MQTVVAYLLIWTSQWLGRSALADLQKGNKFCMKYGIFPGDAIEDCIHNNKGTLVTLASFLR